MMSSCHAVVVERASVQRLCFLCCGMPSEICVTALSCIYLSHTLTSFAAYQWETRNPHLEPSGVPMSSILTAREHDLLGARLPHACTVHTGYRV